MGALTETSGLLYPMKDRRSGKDRRKYIDPRYRNSAYLEFVERRNTERRQPVYEKMHPFVKEHPLRKWNIIISVLVCAFLVYMFFFSNFLAREKSLEEKPRKGSVILGLEGKQERQKSLTTGFLSFTIS